MRVSQYKAFLVVLSLEIPFIPAPQQRCLGPERRHFLERRERSVLGQNDAYMGVGMRPFYNYVILSRRRLPI